MKFFKGRKKKDHF